MPELSSDKYIEAALKTIRTRRIYYELYQRYYEGDQRLAFASEKFRNAFGRVFGRFSDNVCGTVVDALADRLEIKGFCVKGAAEGETDDTLQADIQEIWDDNELELQSNELHTQVLAAGDDYVFVGPHPDDDRMPVFYPQLPQEVTVRYNTEDPCKIDWAAKCWLDEDLGLTRLNMYYPGGTERYVARQRGQMPTKAAAFQHYEEPGQPWPIPNPWGIVPVFPFANHKILGRFGRSELKNVVPLQDALNKTLIDLLVTTEFQAFPQRYVIGMEPPINATTGKAELPWDPGVDRVWVMANEAAKAGQFDAAQLAQFIQVTDSIRLECARVSGTPLHYFLTITDPPSGEALKTLESRLIKRAKDRQKCFGPRWAKAMEFALMIKRGETKPSVRLKTEWQDPAPRSEKEHTEVQLNKKELGVPKSRLLKELGYTDKEVEDFKKENEEESASVAEQALKAFDRGESGRNPTRPGAGNSAPGSNDYGS